MTPGGFDESARFFDTTRADELTPSLLFVYGTMKSDTNLEISRFLARYADYYANGTVRGRLFRIGSYAGAVASDNPADLVHGEVFKLRRPRHALVGLDTYEETGSGHYRREIWRATIQQRDAANAAEADTGRTAAVVVDTWIYVYNRSIEGRTRIVSGRFEQR